MKNDGTFPYYVTTFFKKYLPGQKNLSSNTIHSYSDSFKLMLVFCEEKKGIKSSQLKLENLDRELVIVKRWASGNCWRSARRSAPA